MPEYVTMAAMNGLIPNAFLVQALDDDEDGVADPTAWADVLAAVQAEIDGVLGVRFTVPFANPLPGMVVDAAQVLAAELLYNRRGFAEDKNPWTRRARTVRERLEKIARGELPLTPETQRARPSASIVAEPAKTTSQSGKLTA